MGLRSRGSSLKSAGHNENLRHSRRWHMTVRQREKPVLRKYPLLYFIFKCNSCPGEFEEEFTALFNVIGIRNSLMTRD